MDREEKSERQETESEMGRERLAKSDCGATSSGEMARRYLMYERLIGLHIPSRYPLPRCH